jgi:enamine deaminase RidA (YjgF/YER057c/UK114 family)
VAISRNVLANEMRSIESRFFFVHWHTFIAIPPKKTMSAFTIQHINPDELIKNPAFTNVITVSGSAKTIYIGEQNSNNAAGEVVAKGDIKAQTKQTLKNIAAALKAAGAEKTDVVKWTLHVLQGQSMADGFAAFQEEWGEMSKPPVITFVFVAALANPDYLIGMEAIAVVEA